MESGRNDRRNLHSESSLGGGGSGVSESDGVEVLEGSSSGEGKGGEGLEGKSGVGGRAGGDEGRREREDRVEVEGSVVLLGESISGLSSGSDPSGVSSLDTEDGTGGGEDTLVHDVLSGSEVG